MLCKVSQRSGEVIWGAWPLEQVMATLGHGYNRESIARL